MSASCSHHHDHPRPGAAVPPGYRRALWIALVVNAAMALVEIGSGLAAGSVSLLADAVDFFGDAANYGLSLAVLAMALHWRSRVALLKGWTMAAFGVFVLARAGWSLSTGQVPEAMTMGIVGVLALAANLGVALLLYAYRDGDANMRSVWLCTRNDALGNLAVLAAAAGVFGTGHAWPDLVVAVVMATLALTAARAVLRQAHAELRATAVAPH
jgi:Co/Zn/Cd efflux system component